MKNLAIFNGATRAVGKVGIKLKKYSPEILVAVGTVGVVTSAVMACKATTKLDSILSKSKEDIAAIHKAKENPELLPEQYTEDDAKKDLAIVYTKTGVELIKLYGPSVALGAISIVAIVSSNVILRKRNVALAAAYTVVDKGFKDYRNRVIERFGTELDKELKYNIKAEEIEETIVDKKGKEKTVKKTVKRINPNDLGDFSRIFECGNAGWTKDPEYNMMFLRRQQSYANDILQQKHYLSLNEVFDMLGYPRTPMGQAVGWTYDPKNPDHKGDNYVDFGIYEVYNSDFVNGLEPSLLLDFNVDSKFTADCI